MKVEKLQKLIELPGVFKPRRTSTPIRELDVVQDPDPSIEVIENVFSNTSKKVKFLDTLGYLIKVQQILLFFEISQKVLNSKIHFSLF